MVGVQKTFMVFTPVMFIAKRTQQLDNTLATKIQEPKSAKLVGKDLIAMNVSDTLVNKETCMLVM